MRCLLWECLLQLKDLKEAEKQPLQKSVAVALQSGFSSLNEANTAKIGSNDGLGASSKVKEISFLVWSICDISVCERSQTSGSFSLSQGKNMGLSCGLKDEALSSCVGGVYALTPQDVKKGRIKHRTQKRLRVIKDCILLVFLFLCKIFSKVFQNI